MSAVSAVTAVTAVTDLVRPERLPRSSRYDPAWLLGLAMVRIRCGSWRTWHRTSIFARG
ncbi:hypothetical protein ABZ804_15870 [Streptomyces sp. NPDC047726]|uniref:hypothetical protein n=1 Tax=Streptomyces sp. NPDC047726 TaxID=3156651 RepID=UPI0033EEBF1A